MASQYTIEVSDMQSRLGEQRLIELTDDVGAEAVDDTVVDAAIDTAEEEFHLYAGVYYATPVRDASDNIPDGIRRKLIESAAWFLTQRRSESLRGSQDEGKYWSDRRNEILDWLTAIASADPKKRLVIASAVEKDPTVVEPRAGTATVSADCPRFSSDRMQGFF